MSVVDQTKPSTLQRMKKYRRKAVKNLGRKVTRSIGDFLGRQSTVGDTPVLDNARFPYLKMLTDNWQTIAEEARTILKHREDIPAFHEISPDQKRISKGGNWRTFILYGFGTKLEKNCAQAPETAKLLEKIPNLQTAWFSILSPGYHIPAHRGVTKGILTNHIGLIIPKDYENCFIRVEDQKLSWRPGSAFVFCDAYDHEVYNNTDEERTILLFQTNRPMRFWGRAVHNNFVRLLKLTAFYQEPKKNLQSAEDRFEAAARRANENLEKMSIGTKKT